MKQALITLRNRINNLCAKAVIDLIAQSDDKGKIFMQVEGKADDVKSDVEHLCQYGFRSMPMKGARGVWIAYGGDTDNLSVIVADDKNFGQYDLAEGDVMIYNQNGTRTLYKDDTIISTIAEGGSWQVNLGTTQIQLSDAGFLITINGNTYNFGETVATFSQLLQVNNDINSTGTVTGDTDVVAGSVSGRLHIHGGVSSGGSSTAPPT